MSNRSTGTSFEKELCLTLSTYGFWCHNMAQNSQGQPFDVIVARNGVSYPIDCKVCKNDNFPLSRIEENQYCAMNLWRLYGNGTGWFALQLSNGAVYMLSLETMERAKLSKKTLYLPDIKECGLPLGEWVSNCK